MRASQCLLLVAASLILAYAQESGWPRYSPCSPPTQGDQFVIGLAYWPGGTVLEWGGASTDPSGKPGLNPCIGDVYINESVVNYQQYLSSKGVFFSTFSITVDTMTALRTTRLEEDLLFNAAKNGSSDQVVSVIAFRGMMRSEAQYTRSASSITGGQGVVEKLGLIAAFDKGSLTSLTWNNFNGCNSCGGPDSSTCIRTNYDPVYQTSVQQSCATPLTNKECAPCTSTTCKFVNCSTTTMVAFRGSTTSGQALQSAYQMTSAFKYSIYDILGSILNTADELGNVNIGTAGGGLNSGTGTYLNTSSPLPVPGGAVSDEALSAAQNGQVLPSPPAVVTPAPVATTTAPAITAAPVVTAPVVTTAPVVDPAATTAPVVPAAPLTDPAAATGGIFAPPPPDYNNGASDYNT